jgi:hypothetical protein
LNNSFKGKVVLVLKKDMANQVLKMDMVNQEFTMIDKGYLDQE